MRSTLVYPEEAAPNLAPTVFLGDLSTTIKSEQALGLIGDYELLLELGKGGMGVVYKARQTSADRIVALKVIRADRFGGKNDPNRVEAEQRFLLEAKAAARLQHDNLVTVYDVGEVNGQPYYSMRYVEGQNLRSLLKDGPLENRRAAEIMRDVACGISAVHQHGILHRDLKPDNVLVESSTGRAMVADFGLAKFSEEQGMTLTGVGIGTPQYMPPEQAEDAASATIASDVYSLGATLYHLITGQPPFRGDLYEVLRKVKEETPINPRQINIQCHPDLETLCLKCLEKEPEKRYISMDDLSEEFDRFLSGRPIHARPVGALERGWRWCRRSPVVAGLLSLSAILVVGLFITIVAALREGHRRNTAEIERIQEKVNSDRKLADFLVDQILSNPAQPSVIRDLESVKEHAIPLLQKNLVDSMNNKQKKIYAACALSQLGQVQLQDLIWLIHDVSDEDFKNYVRAFRPAQKLALVKLRQGIDVADKNKSWDLKSRYALVALWLGDAQPASDMCAIRPDPTQRTRFIHAFPKHGNWRDLVSVCQDLNDGPLISAICSGLRGVSPEETGAVISAWKPLLLRWYQTASDTGTQGALNLAFRQWQLPEIQPLTKTTEDRPWYVNSMGMKMIKIPAGQFYMGTDRSLSKFEKPAHEVTLTHQFYLSDREVTVDQFRQFMKDFYTPDSDKPINWLGYDRAVSPTGSHPIQMVNWYDAVLYCNWLSHQEGRIPCYEGAGQDWKLIPKGTGYRLPTEAEWEYACRAGTITKYFFGGEDSLQPGSIFRHHFAGPKSLLHEYAVFMAKKAVSCGSATRENSTTANPHRLFPNPWGLFNMYGNVSEWCQDWAGDYSVEPAIDPMGATMASDRVLRGGSWSDNGTGCRSAFRFQNNPTNRSNNQGFRLAISPSQD